MSDSLRAFHDLPESYVVLDTETTGLPDEEGPPGIVSLGLVRVASKSIVDSKEYRFKPHRAINQEAENVHGISNARAASYPNFDEKWEEIKSQIDNQTIVIHNASFDWPILQYHVDRYNQPPPVGITIFCSQKSAVAFASEKRIPMSQRGPSLDDLTSFLGIEPLRTQGIHGAMIDAKQTALVVEGLRALS